MVNRDVNAGFQKPCASCFKIIMGQQAFHFMAPQCTESGSINKDVPVCVTLKMKLCHSSLTYRHYDDKIHGGDDGKQTTDTKSEQSKN